MLLPEHVSRNERGQNLLVRYPLHLLAESLKTQPGGVEILRIRSILEGNCEKTNAMSDTTLHLIDPVFLGALTELSFFLPYEFQTLEGVSNKATVVDILNAEELFYLVDGRTGQREQVHVGRDDRHPYSIGFTVSSGHITRQLHPRLLPYHSLAVPQEFYPLLENISEIISVLRAKRRYIAREMPVTEDEMHFSRIRYIFSSMDNLLGQFAHFDYPPTVRASGLSSENTSVCLEDIWVQESRRYGATVKDYFNVFEEIKSLRGEPWTLFPYITRYSYCFDNRSFFEEIVGMYAGFVTKHCRPYPKRIFNKDHINHELLEWLHRYSYRFRPVVSFDLYDASHVSIATSIGINLGR